MNEWASHHVMLLMIIITAAQWIFSNLVSSMPKPEEVAPLVSPGKGLAYKWLYSFAHLAAGNGAHVSDALRLANYLPKTQAPEGTPPKAD